MTIRDILTNIRERLQKAGIEDFEYESMAASYREIIAQLCSNKDDSSKNTVKDINVSDSDNKELSLIHI